MSYTDQIKENFVFLSLTDSNILHQQIQWVLKDCQIGFDTILTTISGIIIASSNAQL